MSDACQQVTLLHFWILTLQLFYAVGHNHSAHSVTLYGTSVHICQGALLFSCMNTVQFYGFPFMNVTNMVLVCEMHAQFLYMYPHLMVTFTCMCHILSNILNPFPDHICVWGRGWGRKRQKRRSRTTRRKEKRKWSHDFWSDACIFIYRMILEERLIIYVYMSHSFKHT